VTRKVGIIDWDGLLVLDLSSLLKPGRRRFRRQRRYRWALPRKGSLQAPSIDLLEEVTVERSAAFADKRKLA
jgi:hypothetical protein